MYIIKPSIRNLSEEEIRAALNAKDEENLIVVEFSLMLRNVLEECRRVRRSNGNIADLLSIPPTCAMEKIVLEMIGDLDMASETEPMTA
jgi:hypothetical protein